MKKMITLGAIIAAFTSSAFAQEPVEFQKIPEIMAKFESSQLFRKKTPTLGRLPAEEELGTQFPTYVSDGQGGYSLETNNVMTDTVVVASMPTPIVGEVYNQWLVPKETWAKTYGELPTSTEFKPFKRIKTIKAVKIDDEMLNLMGSEDGKTAIIKVSWDVNGMKVYKDGYLADYEYGIAPEEMAQNYELAK
ncbi:hypothetical protein [Vibrio sp. TBV020]|uniref:hypothetical protein n=1 Tax=Vibrio sp. TBV020 TaxID=3137398 RepID=UPI0038CD5C5D